MHTTVRALCLLSAMTTVAHAKIVTRPVAYEHDGVKLEGWLAYDDARTAKARLPGVLVIHEWWGINSFTKSKTEELAKLGYVAFAVDMYGKGQATDDAKRAGELASQLAGKPLLAERARAGLEQLLKTGLVDGKKVAAIGFCFGGAAAQALGYVEPRLAGVVSFHGSPVNAPAGAVDKIKVRYLLLNGAADPFLKPEVKQAWIKSLDDDQIDFESVDFGEAVHAFMNPEADRMVAKNPAMKGAIGYNATAARRAWRAMEEFFGEIFGGEKAR